MPSVSPKQHRFMEAVAHGWQPRGRHVDVNVAKEYAAADEARGNSGRPQRRPAFMRKR